MRALLQSTTLLLHVHAADAGGGNNTGLGIEPAQLALNLQRQFARGRDNETQGPTLRRKFLRLAQQSRRNGKPKGNRLAGACLR